MYISGIISLLYSLSNFCFGNLISSLTPYSLSPLFSYCSLNFFIISLYFLYSKENVGSAFYYKDVVDGIIFLSAFPCGTDSLVNELAIRKLKNIPCINIILDDSTSTLGLYTRLESFVDIIKVRHNNG